MSFWGNLFANKKERQLLICLSEAADYGLISSQMLRTLCQNPSRKKECCQQIRDIEHNCDQTVKKIHDIINNVFLLPFSHEEFEKLASNLDSIVDCIQGAISRIVQLYKLPDIEKEEELLRVAEILCNMADNIKMLTLNIKNLKKVKNFPQIIDELHLQENEIDDFCNAAKARWHKISQDNPSKLAQRIAWVEIYEHLDWAGNRCLDAADVLGGILQRWG